MQDRQPAGRVLAEVVLRMARLALDARGFGPDHRDDAMREHQAALGAPAVDLARDAEWFGHWQSLLVRKPTLFGESIAHGLVDLCPPCPEAGLRQVLSDGLPTLRFAAGNADIEQYERSDIVKGPEDARASGSSRIHFDRLKLEFAHRIQNTAE